MIELEDDYKKIKYLDNDIDCRVKEIDCLEKKIKQPKSLSKIKRAFKVINNLQKRNAEHKMKEFNLKKGEFLNNMHQSTYHCELFQLILYVVYIKHLGYISLH